jgi:2-methylcitrate dehydratase PrpD
MSATIGERLARHFASLEYEQIPAKHAADAKELVLDYLGVTVAGSQTASGRIAREFALRTGGVPEATLVPSGERVPAVHAAFVNAIASHSVELDDVDVMALFHFSPPVVSAALAAAERVSARGRDLIVAVVAGCEMMARLSAATNPALRDRGFHTTPTCGVFGAAVAAGRLLRLDPARMVSALGLAGAQAGGLMEMYGPSMQKRFNPGPAARDGVAAAIMAELGFTGAATIFDGERSFCRAFSDGVDLAPLTRALGSEFPIFIEFKPYACARPIHNAIDCALVIRREHRPRLEDIRGIVVERHPAWARYHAMAHPTTYHEAQVSLPYSVAVALKEGAALLPQYTAEKLTDAAIRRLAGLVRIVPDPSLPRGVSCRVSVETVDGASLTAQVDHPKGSIENPMTRGEMRGKMHLLADDVVGAAQVERLIETVGRLEEVEDIREITGPVIRRAQAT